MNSLPFSSSQLSSCETNLIWNKNGILIAGGVNATENQKLSRPNDLAFDSIGNLYVADTGNKRSLIYQHNATVDQVPTVIVSNNLCYSLFIDQYDNLYFTDLMSVKIVNRTSGNITIFTGTYIESSDGDRQYIALPYAFHIDRNRTTYMLLGMSTVLRISAGQPENRTIIVAKGTLPADCMFVDETDNDALYFCDSTTRILKISNDGRNLDIVASSTKFGSALNQLSYPKSVIIDSINQQMYITENANQRIIRWSLKNNMKQGEIVIQFSNWIIRRQPSSMKIRIRM